MRIEFNYTISTLDKVVTYTLVPLPLCPMALRNKTGCGKLLRSGEEIIFSPDLFYLSFKERLEEKNMLPKFISKFDSKCVSNDNFMGKHFYIPLLTIILDL